MQAVKKTTDVFTVYQLPVSFAQYHQPPRWVKNALSDYINSLSVGEKLIGNVVINDKLVHFEPGDYIIMLPHHEIQIVNQKEFEEKYELLARTK